MENLKILVTADTTDARKNLAALGRSLEDTGACMADAARQAKATQEAMQSVGAMENTTETTTTAALETELARRREMEQVALEEQRAADAEYLAWRQEQWSAQHERETAMARAASNSLEGFYRRAIDGIIAKQMNWRRANELVSESLLDLAGSLLATLVKTLVQAAVQAVASAFIIEKAMSKPALLTSLATAGTNSIGAIAGIRATEAALVAAETGYNDIVRRPTLFLTGEGYKPEHVQVTPMSGANLHGPAESGLAARLDRLINQVRALQLETVRSRAVVQVTTTAPDVQTQVRRLDYARTAMNSGGYDGRGTAVAL